MTSTVPRETAVFASAPDVIAQVEPRVAGAIGQELADQRASPELIAGENHASPSARSSSTWPGGAEPGRAPGTGTDESVVTGGTSAPKKNEKPRFVPPRRGHQTQFLSTSPRTPTTTPCHTGRTADRKSVV